MWGIVGALQSVLKAKYNITAIMLYFRTAERLVIFLLLEVSDEVPKRNEQRGNSEKFN